MKNVIIDGWIIGDPLYTGAQRYMVEILKELDKIVEYGLYSLILQEKYIDTVDFKNILKVSYKSTNRLQSRVELFVRVKRDHFVHISFFHEFSFGKESIITRHDLYCFYKFIGGTRFGRIKAKIKAYMGTMFACKLVAVSEFTKTDMIKRLHVKTNRVFVIPNAWQHITGRNLDEGIIEKNSLNVIKDVDGQIDRSKSFYMFLGRLVKNKNIKWIFNVADKNPHSIFVIAGALSGEDFYFYKGRHNNIKYTGYVTDEEMVALYTYCKAFLFPSLIEGFGIPPMEALYYGAPVIISNIPALTEVYEDAAHYIDPYKYDYDLDEILKEPVADPQKILDKYSWEKSARQWYELIESIR